MFVVLKIAIKTKKINSKTSGKSMVHSSHPFLIHHGMLRAVSVWRRRCFRCCERAAVRAVHPDDMLSRSRSLTWSLGRSISALRQVLCVCDRRVCRGVSRRPFTVSGMARSGRPRAQGQRDTRSRTHRERKCVFTS